MTVAEKCKAVGIGNGSVYEGYPIVDGRIIREVDGELKAFFDEPLKAWEEPQEDKTFDPAILTKIQALKDGNVSKLTPEEQAALAEAEARECCGIELEPLIRNALLLRLAEERYGTDTEFKALVDHAYPQGAPWAKE